MTTAHELVKRDRLEFEQQTQRQREILLAELSAKREAVLNVIRGRCARIGHEYNSINSSDGFWPGECIWCGVER
jgi:hypothetical protein